MYPSQRDNYTSRTLQEVTINVKKALAGIATLAFAVALSAPAAHADERNQLSYLTFNQPVRIPTPSGRLVVLPAGTYEFRLADTGSPTDGIVQVYNADRSHLYATMPTMPTEFTAADNRDLTDHTVLTFREGAAGEPLTLVKWFYADRNIGHEFVYSGPMQRQLSEEEPIRVVARTMNTAHRPKGVEIASSSR